MLNAASRAIPIMTKEKIIERIESSENRETYLKGLKCSCFATWLFITITSTYIIAQHEGTSLLERKKRSPRRRGQPGASNRLH
jgi:hypothetical protein